MFAIAVWDDVRKKLFLYRDRLGEKPLYYYQRGNDVFFASEIKAILTLPFFRRQMNEEALFYYLSLKHTPRQACFFKGIQVLAPGAYIAFDRQGLKEKQYWQIDSSRELKIDEHDATAEIMRLLKSSVKYRMISDVPYGAYLSGGLDSSTVVALMSRLVKEPVRTFSLTYADSLENKERDQYWAFRMAQKFHTDHREYQMGFQEFFGDLNKIVNAFDEPFGGTISTFFLSKLIRRHVKVAISGDGADELFGSYKAHRLAYPIFFLNKFVAMGYDPMRLSRKRRSFLQPFDQDIPFLLKIKAKYPWQWHSKLTVYSDSEKRLLFNDQMQRKTTSFRIEDYYRKIYQQAKSDDPLNNVLHVECAHLLPDQILTFVDRLSMAHSVEVRPPFLDHSLVEFVFKLPGALKIKMGETKYILKKTAEGILPSKLIYRSKEGFILPYHFWMNHYMNKQIRFFLNKKNLRKHGFFNEAYVDQLVNSFQTEGLNGTNKVLLLLMFQIWWDKYFE
jgi:asparagine synthase (glutamine-hydrolysing)